MEWSEDIFTHQHMIWPGHGRYLVACDDAFRQLRRKSEIINFTSEVPTVVAVVRDEARRLPIFLHHYRGLGVRVFHIVSNSSTDESDRILQNEPGITLWRTEDSYRDAALGQLWIGAIVRRYGIGKWIVNVDVDELLVFPGMDKFGLKHLQAWLERKGDTRLVAHLIDLYGAHRWYDSASLAGTGLFIDKNYNVDQTIYGPMLNGGPRQRMLADLGETKGPSLRKVPLARWNSDTAYANVHIPYPFQDSPTAVFSALLHLKFLDDFETRVEQAILQGEHWSDCREYKLYKKWIATEDGRPLFDPRVSIPFEGVRTLLELGLISSPPIGHVRL
jgi:hypothetical protein